MSEPEPQDPLRSLFQQAGAFGRDRSESGPAVSITERGMRARRRRMAALAVGACLAVGGSGAVAIGLWPVRPGPVAPASIPSSNHPSPAPSDHLLPTAPPPPPSRTLPEPGGLEPTGLESTGPGPTEAASTVPGPTGPGSGTATVEGVPTTEPPGPPPETPPEGATRGATSTP
ncbi:hypothetical protein [Streptomyces pratensis]|uniref:hypothetical protein n=1 Tax=Streptomyces pratensis TaxID=1169025 RepID=UPI0030179B2B